jgi:hypothetical protein
LETKAAAASASGDDAASSSTMHGKVGDGKKETAIEDEIAGFSVQMIMTITPPHFDDDGGTHLRLKFSKIKKK